MKDNDDLDPAAGILMAITIAAGIYLVGLAVLLIFAL